MLKKGCRITLIAILILSGNWLHAQKRNVRDSIVSTGFISAHYGYNMPYGDIYERFGNNFVIGTAAGYKTRKNLFLFGDYSYIFGTEVKEDGILDSIATSDGFLIDQEGKLADIRIFERGYKFHASVGYLIRWKPISPNPNCGILVSGGIGILQHKIRIIDNGNRTPQLRGDYLKGYDRMTSGISFSQFVGYWFMSKSRFVNFYFGFECTEGFTRSRRSWDYDLMKADTRKRTDILLGGRAGWIIPIYSRNKREFY